MKISNSVNAVSVSYDKGYIKQNKSGDEEKVSYFDQTLMDKTPNKLPSFVGRVYTEEELYKYVDEKVKGNSNKKSSLVDLLKKSCPEGTNAKFKFAGESKVYGFFDFIDELEKRSKTSHNS